MTKFLTTARRMSIVAASALALCDFSAAAQVAAAAEEPAESDAPAAEAEETRTLDEIIVTATKRSQNVRDIAGGVTALTDSELSARGAKGLEDAIILVPGAIVNKFEPGFTSVTLRGIASGSTGNSVGQEATGYYINDIPLTDPTINILVPDIDNFDVGDITILRGPQGTLFGSGSLGGSVNYRAAEPEYGKFGGKIELGAEGIAHSSEIGGAAKLMLNAPVFSDAVSARLVLIGRSDPGFINNAGTSEKDSNTYETYGGRFQLSWEISPDTEVKYLSLLQYGDSADRNQTFPDLFGPYDSFSNFPEQITNRVQLQSLRVDHDLGFATLTALANYHDKRRDLTTDSTSGFEGLFGALTTVTTNEQKQKSLGAGFEVRLASPVGSAVEYVVGLMHDETTVKSAGRLFGDNAESNVESLLDAGFGLGSGFGALLVRDGTVYNDFNLRFRGKETALFGEASYNITERLELLLGGRVFEVSSESSSTNRGFLNFFSSFEPQSVQQGDAKETGFTPKISLTYKPTDDFMTYGLVSRGFRFGGPNLFSDEAGFVVPPSFGSDSLTNYEAGVRTGWLNNRLQVDANVFYIDWSDIQVTLFTPNDNQYTSNGGKAVSKGVELTARLAATDTLTISNNTTYLDAKLTESVGDLSDGDVLPGASRWKINNDLAYTREDLPGAPRFLFTHRYVSDAPSLLSAPGFEQGDYNLFDAQLSFRVKSVSVSAFVKNIGDERGIALSFPSNFGANAEFLVRPRTAGITLRTEW